MDVIAELERDAARQARYTKTLIGGAGMVLCAVFIGMAYFQAKYPWKMRHEAPFRDAVPSASVVIGELGSAACIAAAVAAVLDYGSRAEGRWQRLLTTSATMAVVVLIFWATAIVKSFAQERAQLGRVWLVIWKPLAPIAFVAAAATTIDGLHKLRPEFSRLKAARYNLKHA